MMRQWTRRRCPLTKESVMKMKKKNYHGKQCIICRRVQYYSLHGWSGWMPALPKNIMCNFLDVAICNDSNCIQKRKEFITSTLHSINSYNLNSRN